jgi:hypothetical protein
MFIERANTFNSADLGVGIMGYFGGQLPSDYRKNVSKYYAGRWGSWHVGVYNGGGYHATEANNNKIPEVRLSLRPLPDIIPGLQVHYFGLWGKGNIDIGGASPDYVVNLAMLSYQNRWITFTGQWARTVGNNKGSLVVPGTHMALSGMGYSLFVNTKLPVCDRRVNLFARYDHFDHDVTDLVVSGDDAYDLVIGGVAWEFWRHWMLLVAYEGIFYQKNSGGLKDGPVQDNNLADDWKAQIVLQINI